MRRKTTQYGEGPGQDSFLDIVANLIGILIILVMVIGAQATDAMVEYSPTPASSQAETSVDVDAARLAAESVEQDIQSLDSKLKRQQLEIAFRRKERDKFLQLTTQLDQALEAARRQQNDQQRSRLDAQRKLRTAEEELQDLAASRRAVEQTMPQQQVIEHLPTPMAKTVFGKELHFRLMAGRLAYVPWDALVEALKREAPNHVWKLKDASRVTESLGPLGGFRMEFTLRRAEQMARVGGGMVSRQQTVELERFVLVPVRDDLGQPLAAALQPGSEFLDLLAANDPDRTTVTVWVYPDSYNAFRELKIDLFRRGFLAAGRPMPAGHPIGASPDGSRSAVQ
jgi:hypothetical protein